jgi:tRNA A37 threonylcarbamoyladenosine synthetase subunit TsaC/SUA5/YrdC
MVFKATFNNISVLFVAENRVPREYHRSVASHWQTLLQNVVLSTPTGACYNFFLSLDSEKNIEILFHLKYRGIKTLESC